LKAENKPAKPPPLRRWLDVLLRSVHLVGVILLGAALLGAPVAGGSAAAAVAASGLAMFALDTWSYPGHLRELAGAMVLAKLLLVVWMALDENVRPLLFWLVVLGSSVSSHAPARFRHWKLVGRRLAE
jgi:hypothetical protein